jgi:hypothetical protein
MFDVLIKYLNSDIKSDVIEITGRILELDAEKSITDNFISKGGIQAF